MVILLLFRMSIYNTWDWRDLHHHMPRFAISHGKYIRSSSARRQFVHNFYQVWLTHSVYFKPIQFKFSIQARSAIICCELLSDLDGRSIKFIFLFYDSRAYFFRLAIGDDRGSDELSPAVVYPFFRHRRIYRWVWLYIHLSLPADQHLSACDHQQSIIYYNAYWRQEIYALSNDLHWLQFCIWLAPGYMILVLVW